MLPAGRQSFLAIRIHVCSKHALSLHCVPPDVNDNVPFFTSSVYEASVTEGAETGTLVFQVSANDLDLGLNGKVKSKSKKINIIAAIIMNGFILNCPEKFLISTMCIAVYLTFLFRLLKLVHDWSLVHRSPILCWRTAVETTSFSILIQSWDLSTPSLCSIVRPKARICWRFSQWMVRSLQGLANTDNPTLVRDAGQI